MGDPFQQVHDFEPGILPSGLFWTIPVSPSALHVNPVKGSATLRLDDLAVPDYGNFFNAVSAAPDPPPVASHVSFEVTWPGGDTAQAVDDQAFDFSGQFVVSDATITFTARNDNSTVVYRSRPDGQVSFDAGVGRERNGAFN